VCWWKKSPAFPRVDPTVSTPPVKEIRPTTNCNPDMSSIFVTWKVNRVRKKTSWYLILFKRSPIFMKTNKLAQQMTLWNMLFSFFLGISAADSSLFSSTSPGLCSVKVESCSCEESLESRACFFWCTLSCLFVLLFLFCYCLYVWKNRRRLTSKSPPPLPQGQSRKWSN